MHQPVRQPGGNVIERSAIGFAPWRPSIADRVPSLDGLRAMAVFAVLAYHGGVGWVGGGFLGVDLFFVLSGYLITTLLVAEWQRDGTIALAEFWWRRASRLLPALLVL